MKQLCKYLSFSLSIIPSIFDYIKAHTLPRERTQIQDLGHHLLLPVVEKKKRTKLLAMVGTQAPTSSEAPVGEAMTHRTSTARPSGRPASSHFWSQRKRLSRGEQSVLGQGLPTQCMELPLDKHYQAGREHTGSAKDVQD